MANDINGNTNPIISVTAPVTAKTQKCKCCGRILPLEEFNKRGVGYRKTCKTCLRKETGASEKFKDVLSRELIEELKARGYEGTLKKTVVEEIKL